MFSSLGGLKQRPIEGNEEMFTYNGFDEAEAEGEGEERDILHE
jgi:hypothetical protein